MAKATSSEQGEVLEKLGAQVVYPERDMALRIAKKILRDNMIDSISIGKGIEVMEIKVSRQMVGQTIIEMKVREKYGLNIIAIHHDGKTETEINPQYRFKCDDTIAVVGREEKVSQFIDDYS